jgi:hypothetical protein
MVRRLLLETLLQPFHGKLHLNSREDGYGSCSISCSSAGFTSYIIVQNELIHAAAIPCTLLTASFSLDLLLSILQVDI